MPLYDLMVLLDPGVPSDRQEGILRDVQGLLDSGGKVVGNYDWGSRRMTFEIDHRPDAAYHLFQFETEKGGALLERVDHSLKIMDGVLRHRIIRLKDGAPAPPMPQPERRGGYDDYDPSEAQAAPAAPADAAAANGSATDAPGAPADAAPGDAPATGAAATDAPAADAPAADPPVADAPAADAAAAGAPPADAPATDAPVADAPATDAPVADAPATDAPVADAPATDAPAAPEATEPAAEPAPEGDEAPSGPAAA